jgi:hypothetical protein
LKKRIVVLSLPGSFKLKELIELIEKKVAERNREIGHNFYSEKAIEYTYEATIEYDAYKLMLFVCPKSNSTISIKISNKANLLKEDRFE